MWHAVARGYRTTFALLALTLCATGCGLTTASDFPPSPDGSTTPVQPPLPAEGQHTREAVHAGAPVGADRGTVLMNLGQPDLETPDALMYALKAPAGAYGVVQFQDGKVFAVGVW